MRDNASGSVKVTYFSKCLGNERIQTNTCKGLKVGDVVEFETEIVVTSCPEKEKDRVQSFYIYPVGVGEALRVNLEMLCSCSCESSGPTFELESPRCNNAGTLSCGICQSNKDLGNSINDGFKCRANNMTDIECSGKGNCVYGQCQCNVRDNPLEVISGQFCECDNFSCDQYNGVLCSGPDQGVCDCGRCECLEGWSGPACECSTSIETCKAPNGEQCSGHGKCNCGECECEVKDYVRYSGKYCEKCPTCPGRCNEFKSCVECQMYKKGELKNPDDCAKICTLFVPISVDTVDCE
jgi:integrin beta 1